MTVERRTARVWFRHPTGGQRFEGRKATADEASEMLYRGIAAGAFGTGNFIDAPCVTMQAVVFEDGNAGMVPAEWIREW